MRHEIDLFTSSKPKTDERNMNGEREVKETNVFFSLSCNLSELLECFLSYRLLSAPGCQSSGRRRRDMSVNCREPGSCSPLVTDGGSR